MTAVDLARSTPSSDYDTGEIAYTSIANGD